MPWPGSPPSRSWPDPAPPPPADVRPPTAPPAPVPGNDPGPPRSSSLHKEDVPVLDARRPWAFLLLKPKRTVSPGLGRILGRHRERHAGRDMLSCGIEYRCHDADPPAVTVD